MMFDNLSDRLSRTLRNIISSGRLTDDNIKKTLREIRVALLEADVALPVVRDFVSRVKGQALGKEINKSLTPGQEFIKIVHSELIKAMGDKNNTLNLEIKPPAVLLIVGPQGAGKSTSVSKLGKYLREKRKKKVLIVSADIYRPAAIKQIETLAKIAGVDCFQSDTAAQKPLDIVNQALTQAKLKFYDVLLVDTAGCLHIDKMMITEIVAIHAAIRPVETLFVVDAMTGQDAANIAKAFNHALPLTGVILTKIDSDTRGGAAFSVRYITGKPIKFMGIGEKIDALEPFYPDCLVRQILGMGNTMSLIKDLESKFNSMQTEKLANNLKKSNSFDLTHFLEQLKQMHNMSDMASMMSKLPRIGQSTDSIKVQMDEKILERMETIINSMTAKERVNPDIINGSRKRRIASGSGVQIQDVNRLLRQFDNMQRMIKRIKRVGMAKMMRNIKSMILPRFPDR